MTVPENLGDRTVTMLRSFDIPNSVPLPSGYALESLIPPVQTFLDIRVACGMIAKSKKGSTIGLANGLYSCVITIPSSDSSEKEIVGMGRIVGDGGSFITIVDIAILPQHQKKGLGKAIMNQLMKWIKENIDDGCFVTLFADGEAKKLYKQYGFIETEPHSTGMALIV